jgi:hypothetical protein
MCPLCVDACIHPLCSPESVFVSAHGVEVNTCMLVNMVCVCVYIYIYIYVCMYVCMYVCIYIYVCVCVCVCMYAYVV